MTESEREREREKKNTHAYIHTDIHTYIHTRTQHKDGKHKLTNNNEGNMQIHMSTFIEKGKGYVKAKPDMKRNKPGSENRGT